jgi:hypothetical protein
MRNKRVPKGARRLRTYAELESYLADFVAGQYPFVWVVGRPGLAKSESIASATRGRSVYCRKAGQLTPVQFYIDCFHHRGLPIILDDAEHLLDNPLGSKLVCGLGDTTRVRQLSWGSTSRVLGDVPQQFPTTSALLVIANKATAHEAIQSRAVILHFDPTSLEVHRAVARWFWDQEIHNWFGQHLHRLPPLDARWYVHASRDKRASRDWRRIILASHASGQAECFVQDLESDPAYPTREDKARRFVELLGEAWGASRASYFRLRRRLEEQGLLSVEAAPPIALSRSAPPSTPTQAEVDLATESGVPPHLPEPEPHAVDVPLQDSFRPPITGSGQHHGHLPKVLDDLLPCEGRPDHGDGDQG